MRWLDRRRERKRRVIVAAEQLVRIHGERARFVASEFARLSCDGEQVEAGTDVQFWRRVALEIQKRQDNARLDAGTRNPEDS